MTQPIEENSSNDDSLVNDWVKSMSTQMSPKDIHRNAKDARFTIAVDKVEKIITKEVEHLPTLNDGKVFFIKNLFSLPVFTVNKKRKIIKNKLIGKDIKNGNSFFISTMESLNQFDLDVLCVILSSFAGKSLNQSSSFSIYEICKALKMRNAGNNYIAIRKSIDALYDIKITVKNEMDATFTTHLFENGMRTFKSKKENLIIQIKLSELIFKSILNTKNVHFMNLNERLKMKTYTNKWLHGYIVSRYPNPFSISIDRAIADSGYIGRKEKFIKRIKNGLKNIVAESIIEFAELVECKKENNTTHKIVFCRKEYAKILSDNLK